MSDSLSDRLTDIIWESSPLQMMDARGIAEHVIRSLGLKAETVVDLPPHWDLELEYYGGRVYYEGRDATEQYEAALRTMPARRRYVTKWEAIEGDD